jgi:hypothetical protein
MEVDQVMSREREPVGAIGKRRQSHRNDERQRFVDDYGGWLEDATAGLDHLDADEIGRDGTAE